MPETGLEPAPPYEDYTLNVARLPIPPFGQELNTKIIKFRQKLKRFLSVSANFFGKPDCGKYG